MFLDESVVYHDILIVVVIAHMPRPNDFATLIFLAGHRSQMEIETRAQLSMIADGQPFLGGIWYDWYLYGFLIHAVFEICISAQIVLRDKSHRQTDVRIVFVKSSHPFDLDQSVAVLQSTL